MRSESRNMEFVKHVATEDLPAGRVVVRTAGTADGVELAGAGDRPHGMVWQGVSAGQAVTIAAMKKGCVIGHGIAGDAIGVLGTDLASDATGRLVPAVAGDYVVGQAQTLATAADDEVGVMMDTGDQVVPA